MTTNLKVKLVQHSTTSWLTSLSLVTDTTLLGADRVSFVGSAAHLDWH